MVQAAGRRARDAWSVIVSDIEWGRSLGPLDDEANRPTSTRYMTQQRKDKQQKKLGSDRDTSTGTGDDAHGYIHPVLDSLRTDSQQVYLMGVGCWGWVVI